MFRNERFTRGHFEIVTGLIYNYILHAERGIVGLRLNQLTARSVGDFRDGLRSSGVSVPITRKVLGRLRIILDFAISKDLLATNAAKGIKVIGHRHKAGIRTIPLGALSLQMLKAWRMQSRFASDDDLIFPNSSGSTQTDESGDKWISVWTSRTKTKG